MVFKKLAMRLCAIMMLALVPAMLSCSKGTPSKEKEKEKEEEKEPEKEPLPEVVKVLAIGNSFSADAVEQELYGLFNAAGQKIIIGDAYIGGCPLEKHATNAQADNAAYSYRKCVNGVWTTTASQKLSSILADEQWDFVSLQEGAGFHGFYSDTYNGTTHSMEPDLLYMINYVKTKCANKKVKLIYHAPWVAEEGYTGTKFSYYGFDRTVMYNMIVKSTKAVMDKYKTTFSLVMNVMDAIENAKTHFGKNLHRDGWHLNYTFGRYTASCLWYERIMGKSVVGNTYHPATIADSCALVCQTAAHMACEHMYVITDLSKDFGKYTPSGEAAKEILAKWYFTPDRAKSDGYVKTWTGQEELGVYRYSNAAGERGYINANEAGKGKLSYVQVDKTQWPGDAAGLMIFNVSNGGQPVISAPYKGDYWQLETTGKYNLPEGTKIHVIYRYNPGDYGAKYWVVEYKDGANWKPAFEMKSTTVNTNATPATEQVDYNIAFTKSQQTVEFTAVLENSVEDIVVRQRCSSTYQVNDKWFAAPNVKCVSRIAGDPANAEKPLPEIDKML